MTKAASYGLPDCMMKGEGNDTEHNMSRAIGQLSGLGILKRGRESGPTLRMRCRRVIRMDPRPFADLQTG
eukprot:1190751-Prorocentrum_minimum.AAC.3